ncbi:MAG: histidine phosphatase family protein [Calditrichota bacterium]
MPNIILIKHAMPEILQSEPAKNWVLSEAGIASCNALADAFAGYEIQQLFSSREIKAVQTAEIVGEQLGLVNTPIADLHENDRNGFPFFENPEDWKQQFREFFANPGQRIIGNESAEEALARFEKAVRDLIRKHADESLAIVAHGTVITLLVAAYHDIEPFEFWASLELPSFVVLEFGMLRLM